ncbi:LPS translocon maturation chaperone LptM [Acinetobacter indicus]|uniref:LPS translocon maturation chaperone LptM n=1 Tax=Acinetobacter indicus TaxID=756892 RepID=UPI0025776279|nr:hypothetical protein [Acinetobacter indicus]MDM1285209.1 hypothetical protein [Acinetobacter indicus]
MRSVICCISLLTASFVLVGCGQSGVLQLPSDPNYDKRAKYLLYPNVDSEQHPEEPTPAPVQQQFAAPVASNSTTTP